MDDMGVCLLVLVDLAAPNLTLHWLSFSYEYIECFWNRFFWQNVRQQVIDLVFLLVSIITDYETKTNSSASAIYSGVSRLMNTVAP